MPALQRQPRHEQRLRQAEREESAEDNRSVAAQILEHKCSERRRGEVEEAARRLPHA